MGKISPISGKYIIHANIKIDGVVEKPDVIGAIFGQTEGLLGAELELRELQRSGRIGRIEVNTTSKSGKVEGEIIIPSSLDKAETAIIAAALEIIERIGPCNAKILVSNIEDIRISKRNHVIQRAKELLQSMLESVIPDSTELADEVGESVRVMEVTTYGPEKLPAGPAVADSEEIIVVEGRADVLTLLKYGIKNAIAMNGSNVPKTIGKLSKEKTVIVFVDGDRGGDLNVRELMGVAELDFVARAPDGKEVEELTQKEILKALRGKMTPEQFEVEIKERSKNTNTSYKTKSDRKSNNNNRRADKPTNRRTDKREPREPREPRVPRKKPLTDDEKEVFSEALQSLLGTKGATLLDSDTNILGKVPIKELISTLKSLKGNVYAVAIDGVVNSDILDTCNDAKVKFLVGMDVDVDSSKSRVSVFSASNLE